VLGWSEPGVLFRLGKLRRPLLCAAPAGSMGASTYTSVGQAPETQCLLLNRAEILNCLCLLLSKQTFRITQLKSYLYLAFFFKDGFLNTY